MRWQKNEIVISTPQIPFLVKGNYFDITLSLCTDEGEDINGAGLLCRDAINEGIVSAKFADGVEYLSIGSTAETAFPLGNISANSEIDIDFRVSVSRGSSDGLYVIPVSVIYGIPSAVESPYFSADLDSYFNVNLSSYFQGTV